MAAKFGPAGNSSSFKEQKGKTHADIVRFVKEMDLDAYEYQCGRGVKIGEDAARAFGELAAAEGLALSLHAPYYISLSSVEPEKRDNSIRYILQSAAAAKAMGAARIVVHAGSCGKLARAEALTLAKDTLSRALAAMDEQGLGDVTVCPETMGKVGQLGTLEEVLALCGLDERLLPCIDFGHLNARTFGGLRTRADFEAIFDAVENALGADRMRRYHAHFSKIEYTQKGGEKMHLTFADTVYGPDFEPVLELTAQKNASPVIICESAGTQAEDAATMKAYYRKLIEIENRE